MADTASQFVAFYPDALLYLTRSGDAEALSVFFALCKRANRFGGCDPGDRDLSALSGRRFDAIPALLERLQAIDYIHIIETPVPYRLKPLRGYQVSPYVLRLGIDNQAAAIAEWQRFNPQTNARNEKQTSAITYGENDQQPESDPEPESKPALKPESQPAIQTKTSAEGAAKSKSTLKGEGQGQGQGQGQKQREAPPDHTSQATESTLFRRAHPSEPRSLLRYHGMLPDGEQERLAVNLKSLVTDLSLPNARMLTDVYGTSVINAAMQEFWCNAGAPKKSPARWIRTVIRRLYATEEIEARINADIDAQIIAAACAATAQFEELTY